MQCNRCRSDPVIFQPYSGRNLCRDHFIADFEARAKRLIRQHQWMRPGDHLAVPLSGDRASSALLSFLQDLAACRRDIWISVIPLNRDIRAGTDTSSYDEKAAGIHATRLALATSLDDVAVSVLSGIFRGLPGPVAGAPVEQYPDKGVPVPRISPFSGIPAEEIVLYAQLRGVGSDIAREDPGEMFHNEVKNMLDEYSSRHPATKYAVVNLGHELARCSLYTGEEIA